MRVVQTVLDTLIRHHLGTVGDEAGCLLFAQPLAFKSALHPATSTEPYARLTMDFTRHVNEAMDVDANAPTT